jgi:hypothetical protein
LTRIAGLHLQLRFLAAASVSGTGAPAAQNIASATTEATIVFTTVISFALFGGS